MKSRSSDDIRHYWNNNIMTVLMPNQSEWSDEEDIELLRFIAAQDIGSLTMANSNIIPFDGLSGKFDSKTPEQCRQRWFVLLKGMGSLHPGQKFDSSEMAEQLIQKIEKRDKVSVVQQSKNGQLGMTFDRNGDQVILEGNFYIDIVRYFNKHFK